MRKRLRRQRQLDKNKDRREESSNEAIGLVDLTMGTKIASEFQASRDGVECMLIYHIESSVRLVSFDSLRS